MNEWKPIESAPKETQVQIYVPTAMAKVVTAVLTERGWATLPGVYQAKPTHWMPLSAPPVDEKAPQV